MKQPTLPSTKGRSLLLFGLFGFVKHLVFSRNRISGGTSAGCAVSIIRQYGVDFLFSWFWFRPGHWPPARTTTETTLVYQISWRTVFYGEGTRSGLGCLLQKVFSSTPRGSPHTAASRQLDSEADVFFWSCGTRQPARGKLKKTLGQFDHTDKTSLVRLGISPWWV